MTKNNFLAVMITLAVFVFPFYWVNFQSSAKIRCFFGSILKILAPFLPVDDIMIPFMIIYLFDTFYGSGYRVMGRLANLQDFGTGPIEFYTKDNPINFSIWLIIYISILIWQIYWINIFFS